MRTAMRSDAPSASDSGTSTVVLDRDARGSARATTTSSCSTHAVSEIAAATTTRPRRPLQPRPFVHARRGAAPRDVPDQADDRVGAATITTGQSATCGRSISR